MIICVGCVNKTNQLGLFDTNWKCWKVSIKGNFRSKLGVIKFRTLYCTFELNTPIFRKTEIVLYRSLQVRIVWSRQLGQEFGHGSDSNISLQHFAKKGTVTKTRFRFKRKYSYCTFIRIIFFENFMNSVVWKGRRDLSWCQMEGSIW